MGLIFSGIVFGAIGLAYFVYGKKAQEYLFLFSGMGLMIYPYFIQTLWISVVIGIVITVLPILAKRFQ